MIEISRKFWSEIFLEMLAPYAHRQVAKYSDVKLNKGEVERALKTAFKG